MKHFAAWLEKGRGIMPQQHEMTNRRMKMDRTCPLKATWNDEMITGNGYAMNPEGRMVSLLMLRLRKRIRFDSSGK